MEPMALPGFWKDEESGVLLPAIEAYLNSEPMTPDQIAAMRAYLRQWVNAPGWVGGVALDNLRAGVDQLTSVEMIRAWVALAEQIGIDPL